MSKRLKDVKPEIVYREEIDGSERKPIIPPDTNRKKGKMLRFKSLKPELWKSEKQGKGPNKYD